MPKEYTTVRELINEISTTRTQTSANAKDEIRVALAMLNDPTYVVDVYNKNGVSYSYCPYDDARSMIADIIKDATKVSADEAAELAYGYQFTKSGAQTMISFSKEYINTYLQTGRKLPLGCRERSNCALVKKEKEAKVNSFPVPTAVDGNGNKTYNTSASMTPAYDTIKVIGSCPAHLKK